MQRYQKVLEESMRRNEFIFDSIDTLYYNLNKISLVRCGSYTDTPKFIKNKKATINPKTNGDRYFLYAVTAAQNTEQIQSHSERTSNIKSY